MENQNPAANPPASYTWWGEVPAHLVTRTRLAELDLPRQPGGPVRATISTRDPLGKKATYDLYDLNESVPTTATVAQLAAAAARRTTGARTCEQCGARPEIPCTKLDGWLLCRACAHIARLRAKQKEAAEKATAATDWAARLLDDEHLAVVAVEYTHRPPSDTGKARTPAAARITAIDTAGASLYDTTLRLVGPRTKGVPEGAVDPEDALAALREILAERNVLVWDTEFTPFFDALRRLKEVTRPDPFPSGYKRQQAMLWAVLDWRADLDPRTGQHHMPAPPTTAERTLYLLRQLAGSPAVQHLGEAPLPGL
ncbi:hypothetical protein [Kitasatospora sp. NBC_01302]|uniref:hypothetical protein n=1 Tax=Kitasatospora sp. NBC_01302 TaxID=2903575 RepID=UPI002E11C20B|nr:hypothetical protein OG294_40745 [Kitasatospora sp. NBC_01302]